MKKRIIGGIVISAVALGIIVCNAFGVPRVAWGLLERKTSEVIAQKSEEQLKKLSEVQFLNETTVLDSFFDEKMSEKEFASWVALGKQVTSKAYEGTRVDFNEETFQITWPDGTVEDAYLGIPDVVMPEGWEEVYQKQNDRVKLLEEQYIYDELRPQKSMPYATKGYGLYYNQETCKMNLPARELTDEEILQYLDFQKRIEYVIRIFSGQRDFVEEMQLRGECNSS